jgi:hypothetical protein
MTYSLLDSCGNHSISAKYVVDNLLMCGIRVNTHTHTHSHRAYFIENILNIKELANLFSRVLLTFSSDFYLRNGAPPLRVVAAEALHHPITALSVGIYRAFSETSYFI